MKYVIAALLVCIAIGTAIGDPVMQPLRMQFLSKNRRFLMEIVTLDGTKKNGWKRFEIVCYATGSRGSGRLIGNELWRSKGWHSYTCYLSNDGRSAVQVDQITRSGFDRLIRFYRDGIEVGSFDAEDLVPKLKKFGPFETKHWLYGDAIRPEEEAQRAEFSDEHHFRFKTIDGVSHVFDFTTFTLDGKAQQRGGG